MAYILSDKMQNCENSTSVKTKSYVYLHLDQCLTVS